LNRRVHPRFSPCSAAAAGSLRRWQATQMRIL
jgi:hypothetical protein